MRIATLAAFATSLSGVTEKKVGGLLQWRYQGRLVVRELDEAHVVVRCSFDLRDELLKAFPDTFSVPKRFDKHMMVVAELEGDDDAIESAVTAAWRLQMSD